MIKRLMKTAVTITAGGFAMWILAGLWHNLVLPAVNSEAEAHHDGLVLMLLAYFILSAFITWFYTGTGRNNLQNGIKIGALIGIVWVLPHGLTMAGAHGTSVLYEFKNALWHCFEQGAGGLLIALMKKDESFF